MPRSSYIQTRGWLYLVPYHMERRKLRTVHGYFRKTAGKRRGRRLKQTNAAITINQLTRRKEDVCLTVLDVDLFVNNHFAFALVTINHAERQAAALQKGMRKNKP